MIEYIDKRVLTVERELSVDGYGHYSLPANSSDGRVELDLPRLSLGLLPPCLQK